MIVLDIIIALLIWNFYVDSVNVEVSYCQSNLSYVEYDALKDFYTSTNGPNWCISNTDIVGYRWNFSTNSINAPCEDNWYGIVCSCTSNANAYTINRLEFTLACLSGSLPSSIGNFSNIYTLIVEYNDDLVGRIPPTLGLLTSLRFLSLSFNGLQGPIPLTFGNLLHLYNMELNNNYLSGPIPMTISGLTSLGYLDLSSNSIMGSIPSSLFKLPSLYSINLGRNRLLSTIPDVASKAQLSHFTANDNALFGSIPTMLTSMSTLISLELSGNDLSQSLPEFNSLPCLSTLALGDNMFTHTIPSSLFDITTLQNLNLSFNRFDGSIPESIGNSSSLTILELQVNSFDGSLPDTITRLTTLSSLSISSNHFTGSLPYDIGHLTNMQRISLNLNSFSGSLPSSLKRMGRLLEFVVDNNRFTGKFFSIFNASTNPTLQVVNIANNLFSGTIGPFFSNMAQLSVVIGVNNCLEGTIPSSICSASHLEILDFDGSGANQNCDANLAINGFLPFFIKGKFSQIGLKEHIPPCIFQHSKLTTLHLSGSSLWGPLPELSNRSLITDLSVSSNFLTGSIPESIQLHQFTSLDLSSNRLDGTLNSKFMLSPHQSKLQLSVNRITGPFPQAIKGLSNDNNLTILNILASNIFSCRSTEDIPDMDEYSASYSCGSNDLNVALYIWAVSFGLVSCTMCVFIWLRTEYLPYTTESLSKTPNNAVREGHEIIIIDPDNSIKSNHQSWTLTSNAQSLYASLRSLFYRKVKLILAWWNTASSIGQGRYPAMHETKGFLTILKAYRLFGFFIVSVCILIILPAYYSMNTSSSAIVTYKYSFILSMAFLHGIPIAIFIIFMMSFLSILWVCFTSQLRILLSDYGYRHRHRIYPFQVRKMSYYTIIYKYLLVLIFHIINFAVTLTVNFGYVSVILTSNNENVPRNSILLIQFGLGLFKLVWNLIFIEKCSSILAKYYSASFNMRNHLFMAIMIWIVSPFIATLAYNRSCFYYALQSYSSEYSTIDVAICSYRDQNTDCIVQDVVTLSIGYTPPFQYSASCGTAWIISYVPVLLYSYFASAVIMPIIRLTLLLMYPLNTPLPTVPSSLTFRNRLQYYINKGSYWLCQVSSNIVGKNIVMLLSLHTTVLLTFGLASPVLGFTIVLTIVNDINITKLRVGRLMHGLAESVSSHTDASAGFGDKEDDSLINSNQKSLKLNKLPNPAPSSNASCTTNSLTVSKIDASSNDTRYLSTNTPSDDIKSIRSDNSKLPTIVLILEELNMKDSWKGFYACYHLVVTTISSFWALLLFDMIVDRYGAAPATTVTIVFGIGCPLIIFGSIYAYKHTQIVRNAIGIQYVSQLSYDALEFLLGLKNHIDLGNERNEISAQSKSKSEMDNEINSVQSSHHDAVYELLNDDDEQK